MGAKILVGWKAIANYLNVARRTAIRWEQLGMPVYNRGPRVVAADPAELDAWMIRKRIVRHAA